ncbi:MAG: diaminopimelate decarboxylase [Myxococcota bacterium]|nr:diaminopimelate decarboxylase [Myxococcota bacterium]
MDHFQLKDGSLHCEDISLERVAAEVGTPTYVYSGATLRRHVKVLKDAFEGIPHHICYAVKANGNLALLQILRDAGCEFDAVSVGELKRVQQIGVPGDDMIFSGVGKRDDEIEAALRASVKYICVESEEELMAIASIAAKLDLVAPVSLRVNPDVDPKTHPYIATGLEKNKFGVPFQEAPQLYQTAIEHAHLNPVGVTCHIGSQVTTLSPFIDAAKRMAALAQSLTESGAQLRYLGMGGGLGIPYKGETPPAPKEYGEALAEILKPLGMELVLEPGRVIVGNAGVLLTQVVRRKQGASRHFTLVDAGMNDLIRPALYQADHEIVPVHPERLEAGATCLVGPVCESSDTFSENWTQGIPMVGSLLAIRSAGAYGAVMATTYNGRPRPAEVICVDGQMHIARERDSIESTWMGEALLPPRS